MKPSIHYRLSVSGTIGDCVSTQKKKIAPKKKPQNQKASSSKGKPAPPAGPKLQLWSENENRLRRLLLNSGRSEPSPAPSDESISKCQKAKRLRSAYEKLSCDGFKDDQIELALSTLKDRSTYEIALDWLCLNIPGNELPLKFSSGGNLHTTGGSVGVISTAREDWVSSRDSPAPISEEKAEVSLRIKERKDDEKLLSVQSSQADWIRQYMEQQEEIAVPDLAELFPPRLELRVYPDAAICWVVEMVVFADPGLDC